jgi:hypothetical protein
MVLERLLRVLHNDDFETGRTPVGFIPKKEKAKERRGKTCTWCKGNCS